MNYHIITAKTAEWKYEYFTGWVNLNNMDEPVFSSDPFETVRYTINKFNDELNEDVEKLEELGFDVSVEKTWCVA